MLVKRNKNTGDYELLDSGDGRKLERFGDYILSRPCEGAVWKRRLSVSNWNAADADFDSDGSKSWTFNNSMPESWVINTGLLSFKLAPAPFGHIGIFPEQIHAWSWIIETLWRCERNDLSVLNLFAHSGGSSLAAARAGAKVCNLDSSKGMTQRARENADLNGLSDAPVRWIVDDVHKFLEREKRRGSCYDAIILDPPSFGRGKAGEVFKIESSIKELLSSCAQLLTGKPLFVYVSCHTPAFTSAVMYDLLTKTFGSKVGKVVSGELYLTGGKDVRPVEDGTYAIWESL